MTSGPARLALEGRQWGRYRIERFLGAGGMGIVYRAVHVELKRPVAIKILKPELADEPGLLDRFNAEARAAASLNHPNLAVVHDVGEADGFHYFVMDLVEGDDLGTLIDRQGPLPVLRALEIAEQIARALEHAHGRRVIHRDVKPQNVLMGPEGMVKVTDFGIARALEGSRMTTTGVLVGTPEYLAPEQALGQPTDARSDVYALGIVLYEMLAGRVPFHGETPVAVAMQQVSASPPPLRGLNPAVPPEVEAVVMRALAKKPEERFPSAGVMADALARVRRTLESRSMTREIAIPEGTAPPTAPASLEARQAAGGQTVKWAAAAVVILMLLGGGAIAWSIMRGASSSVQDSGPAPTISPVPLPTQTPPRTAATPSPRDLRPSPPATPREAPSGPRRRPSSTPGRPPSTQTPPPAPPPSPQPKPPTPRPTQRPTLPAPTPFEEPSIVAPPG